jgi:hypothetical protein
MTTETHDVVVVGADSTGPGRGDAVPRATSSRVPVAIRPLQPPERRERRPAAQPSPSTRIEFVGTESAVGTTPDDQLSFACVSRTASHKRALTRATNYV